MIIGLFVGIFLMTRYKVIRLITITLTPQSITESLLSREEIPTIKSISKPTIKRLKMYEGIANHQFFFILHNAVVHFMGSVITICLGETDCSVFLFRENLHLIYFSVFLM